MKGVNPKGWFWDLQAHLNARPNESRAALATAAGEQWLNGELMGCLAARLPETLTVRSEQKKRDISVCTLENKTLVVLELKLVYRSYPDVGVEHYARDLLRQMKANSDAGYRSVGWFGSIFNTCDAGQLRVRRTFEEERVRSGRILRRVAREIGATVAKPTLNTVLSEAAVRIGGVSWQVGLAAQYLELE